MLSRSKAPRPGEILASHASNLPAESIRAQVERILASPPLVRSERLSRFLRFTVEQTLQGDGRRLKEYLLGVEVFDRSESFDPRTENIVRVEARRLRTCLVEYYATAGRDDPILIEFPKGTYTPVFEERAPVPAVESRRHWTFKRRDRAWAAMLFLIGAAIYGGVRLQQWTRSSGPRPSSVAVLPFVNLTGNPDLEYLCDGITDDLINGLARDRQLQVVSRTSSFQFKGKSLDIRQIGQRLNVSTVLEGSIRKVGDRLRIAAQLIQMPNGYSLWSGTYERDLDDAFKIQEEISQNLARALGGQSDRERVRRPSENPEAWIHYQKGRYFWHKWTPEGVQKSIEYYEQAIAADAGYTLAYAGLADAWGVLGHWGVLPPREASPKRDAALSRALQLNDQLPEVRVPLAMKKAYYEWDWAGAEREFRRILEADPGSAEVYRSFGVVLANMGRFDEANQQFQRALTLDPLSLQVNLAPGTVLFYQGRYDSAIEHGGKLFEMDPNFYQAHLLIGWSYQRKRMHLEAIEALKRARELAPGNTEIAAALGYACGQAGDRQQAEQLLEEMHQLEARRRVSPIDFAVILLGLGEKSKALALLERAYDERDGRLVRLKVDPVYESLQPEPAYRSLLKRVGLDM